MKYPDIDVNDELTRGIILNTIETIKVIDKVEDNDKDKYISFINTFMGMFTKLEFIEKHKIK